MKIKGDAGYFEIKILSESNIDEEYHWLTASICVEVSGFKAHFVNSIEECSLRAFLDSLKNSFRSGESIKLITIEDTVTLEGINNGFGKTIWEGRVQYPEGNGSVLTFKLESDTELNRVLIYELENNIDELVKH